MQESERQPQWSQWILRGQTCRWSLSRVQTWHPKSVRSAARAVLRYFSYWPSIMKWLDVIYHVSRTFFSTKTFKKTRTHALQSYQASQKYLTAFKVIDYPWTYVDHPDLSINHWHPQGRKAVGCKWHGDRYNQGSDVGSKFHKIYGSKFSFEVIVH